MMGTIEVMCDISFYWYVGFSVLEPFTCEVFGFVCCESFVLEFSSPAWFLPVRRGCVWGGFQVIYVDMGYGTAQVG